MKLPWTSVSSSRAQLEELQARAAGGEAGYWEVRRSTSARPGPRKQKVETEELQRGQEGSKMAAAPWRPAEGLQEVLEDGGRPAEEDIRDTQTPGQDKSCS